MTDRPSNRGRTVALFSAILLAAVVLRVWAFSPFDIIHADEIRQYQEQAHRIVFGFGLVPWESHFGVRNALIPELMALPMALGAWISPDSWLPLILTRTVFAIVCLAAIPAAYAIGSVTSRPHGLVAMFVAAIWYESVVFDVHVLSESLSAAWALGGAAAILRARESRRAALLAGFLLAMAVLIRLQYAAFVAPLVLLTAVFDRLLWIRLFLGAVVALAIGAVADLAAGMTPFSWVWMNFRMNIVEGRAVRFGTSDSLEYLRFIWVRLFPAAVPVMVAAAFSGRRYRPLLIAALANIAAHSLIAHKEYRFIWLSVLTILVLAAIATVNLLNRTLPETMTSPRKRGWALAGLCMAWGALSLLAFRATGGIATFRSGAPVVRTAIEAAENPQTCGIGIAEREGIHLGYVFLRRPVPVYLLPDEMNDGKVPFSKPVTAAINAIIVTGNTAGPPGYSRVGCRQYGSNPVCLYRREGDCSNLQGVRQYEFQALIAKDNLLLRSP